MIIDCQSCTVRGASCSDCVVTFLTIGVRGRSSPPGTPADLAPTPVDLDVAEQAAIGALAASGLVPPLRMAPAV
ncbi:hypothetical protein [Cellulomonas hominis]